MGSISNETITLLWPVTEAPPTGWSVVSQAVTTVGSTFTFQMFTMQLKLRAGWIRFHREDRWYTPLSPSNQGNCVRAWKTAAMEAGWIRDCSYMSLSLTGSSSGFFFAEKLNASRSQYLKLNNASHVNSSYCAVCFTGTQHRPLQVELATTKTRPVAMTDLIKSRFFTPPWNLLSSVWIHFENMLQRFQLRFISIYWLHMNNGQTMDDLLLHREIIFGLLNLVCWGFK